MEGVRPTELSYARHSSSFMNPKTIVSCTASLDILPNHKVAKTPTPYLLNLYNMNPENIPQILPALSIDTLRVLIEAQPRLSHRRILEEVHRHPHQMPLNLIQPLLNICRIDVLVEQVTLFVLFWGKELVVLFKIVDFGRALAFRSTES